LNVEEGLARDVLTVTLSVVPVVDPRRQRERKQERRRLEHVLAEGF
jgi:hypothetical protein